LTRDIVNLYLRLKNLRYKYISLNLYKINTMTITLNEEQVKQLDAFIQELPTKYGLPLTQFLSKLAQEQNPEEVKEETEA